MTNTAKALYKEDKKSMAGVIICNSFYKIINLFVSTFLIAYIYTQAVDVFDYIFKSCLYEISSYFGMLIFVPLFSIFVKKFNKVWILRFGCLTKTVFVVCLIFFGKQLSQWVFLAGLLNGLASSLYYAAHNVIKQDVVSIKAVKYFTTISNIVVKIVLILSPMLLGALIDISTYTMVAVYVALIGIIQFSLTFLIKDNVKEKSFSFNMYFKEIKKDNHIFKQFKSFYSINAVYSFYSVLKTLFDINVMLVFGNNFSLGFMFAIYAAIHILVYFLFTKFTIEGKRSWVFVLLFSLPIFSSILFATNANVATLIIFNVCIALNEGVARNVFDLYRFRILKEVDLSDRVTEHQTIIEVIFNVFRIIGYSVVIAISFLDMLIWFKIVFCLFAVLFGMLLLMMARYEKKYAFKQNSIKNKKSNNHNKYLKKK